MTTAVPARRRGVPRISFRAVPPSLRPALRAFLLGFASTVGPRLVSLLARYVKSKRAATDENEKIRIADSLRAVLASGFGWNRFPAFCALFVGGSTFLEVSCPPWTFFTLVLHRRPRRLPIGPLAVTVLPLTYPHFRSPYDDYYAKSWALVSLH